MYTCDDVNAQVIINIHESDLVLLKMSPCFSRSTHHNHEESMAPDDMYYDNLHGLSPDERRQMYALGVDEAEFKYMEASMTKEQVSVRRRC